MCTCVNIRHIRLMRLICLILLMQVFWIFRRSRIWLIYAEFWRSVKNLKIYIYTPSETKKCNDFLKKRTWWSRKAHPKKGKYATNAPKIRTKIEWFLSLKIRTKDNICTHGKPILQVVHIYARALRKYITLEHTKEGHDGFHLFLRFGQKTSHFVHHSELFVGIFLM